MADNLKAAGCLALFGTPFAVAGAFVGYLAVSDVLAWHAARGWVEVPARIVEAELVVSRGDDSTTYRVEALYDYELQGVTYTGSRVSLSAGSDNIGSFHQDAYRELSAHRDSGEPFRCFVDPEEPTEALLYRRLRPGLLAFQSVFALLFGGVGVGLVVGAFVGKAKLAADAELRRSNPDTPWRWREDWREGVVASGSKGRLIFAVIFAAIWNLVSAPVMLFVPEEVAGGNHLALLALIFPLVGAGLATWAIVSFLQWWRFGSATFELHRVPGVLGGTLEGAVASGLADPPRGGVRLTLSCVRTRSRGSRRSGSRSQKVLWQDSYRVRRGELGHGPNGVSVPVYFALPHDAPESSVAGSVSWCLEADAELPGLDYDVAFDVPVFRTPDSDPDFDADSSRHGEYNVEDDADAGQRGIDVEDLGAGGRRYVFGRARNPAAAVGLTAFLVLWLGVIWLMVWGAGLLVMPVIFGLFGVLMVLAALELWLTQRSIEVRPGSLRLARRMLGPRRWKEFAADDVRSIRPVPGMRAGQRLYHRLQLRLADGSEHLLATGLPSLRYAEGIARDLKERLRPN